MCASSGASASANQTCAGGGASVSACASARKWPTIASASAGKVGASGERTSASASGSGIRYGRVNVKLINVFGGVEYDVKLVW